MVQWSDSRREYNAAGALHEHLPVWAFLDDYTFTTFGADLGLVFRVHGVDHERLDHADRDDVSRRVAAAFRQLGNEYTVYQYAIKRRMPPVEAPPCAHPVVADVLARRAEFLNTRQQRRQDDLYETAFYLVLLLDGAPMRARGPSTTLRGLWTSPRQAVSEWLSPSTVATVIEADLIRAVATLRHAGELLMELADTIRPTLLSKYDAYTFLRRLVNYDPQLVEAPFRDRDLDWHIVHSAIDWYRDHAEMAGRTVGPPWHVQVLTMKETPENTYTGIFSDLLAVPGEFLTCLEWQLIAPGQAARMVSSRKKYFHHERESWMAATTDGLSSLESGLAASRRGVLINESADASVQQMGGVQRALGIEGRRLGWFSFTVVLFDRDPHAVALSADGMAKVFARHDAAYLPETYNQILAWRAIVPGNSAYNVRRRKLSVTDENVADMSNLFRLDEGERVSAHLDQPALAILSTSHRTPYSLNIHHEDIGHALVLGPTGSGKSYWLKFYALQAQQYHPLTVIFEMGHDFERLSTLLGGSYVDLADQRGGVTLNPFTLVPTPDNKNFLNLWLHVLLEGSQRELPLTPHEDREVALGIDRVYHLHPTARRLGNLMSFLSPGLQLRLSKWVAGGQHGDFFDHATDTLTVAQVQVFELSALREYHVLMEAWLFYVLHRVHERILTEPGLTLCLMDEAWHFIRHPVLRDYVQRALKTWRKHNAAMVLATHSLQDFAGVTADVDLVRTVLDSTPTKIVLGSSAEIRQEYATTLQLNPVELELLANMPQKRAFLLKRPGLTKLLTLDVDPKTHWILTNTPKDNERYNAAVRAYGVAGALEHLATV